MRTSAIGACVALVALSWSPEAGAYANDLEYWRLGSPVDRPSTPAITADPLAQERFARLASSLGLAMLPMPGGSAHSVGDAGFDFSFAPEFALVSPNQTFSNGLSSEVWVTSEPLTGPLFLPTLHFKKGLPLSFEVDTTISYLTASRMLSAAGSVKWSVIEGFQWWPDVAVRAFASVLIGGGPMNVTVAGWDAGGGYRIPLMGSAELTIFGGFQKIGISASTNSIDFAPKTEDTSVPQADDAVFNPLSFGANFFEPTTSFQRVYFGTQLRVGLLLLAFDAAYASGKNRIDAISTTEFSVELWKVGGRVGVQF